jgi:hypothetical protein
MTGRCIKELNYLRNNTEGMFNTLSLEQLIFECLNANQWDKSELIYIIDSMIEDKKDLIELNNDHSNHGRM